MRTGVRLILLETLEQLAGSSQRNARPRFDPNVHDAIIESEAPGQLPGIVTRVVGRGLRHSSAAAASRSLDRLQAPRSWDGCPTSLAALGARWRSFREAEVDRWRLRVGEEKELLTGGQLGCRSI